MDGSGRRSRHAPLNLYSADLAYIHHVGFGGFAHRAAPALLTTLERHGVESGTVIDLGCGSGIWPRYLTDRGFKVIGIDASPAMITIARDVAPAATYRTAPVFRAALPACSAVTAIGEGLNYGAPTSRRPPQLSRLFARIFRALQPGGVFLFDVMVAPLDPIVLTPQFHEGEDWAVGSSARYLPGRRRLRRRITTFRRYKGRFRRSHETHTIWLYDRLELLEQLQGAGFNARSLTDYGDYPLLPSRAGFVAQKARH